MSSTTPRLLPTEQRVVDALAARGLTLTDRVSCSAVESVAAELGWVAATVKRELAEARSVCREHPPERTPGTLTPREERLVDELETLGYSVAHRIPAEVLGVVAARLGNDSLSAVKNLLVKVRKAWNVGATAPPRLGVAQFLEAPRLPLGCTDPAVVARCQREGRRLAEAAERRVRGC